MINSNHIEVTAKNNSDNVGMDVANLATRSTQSETTTPYIKVMKEVMVLPDDVFRGTNETSTSASTEFSTLYSSTSTNAESTTIYEPKINSTEAILMVRSMSEANTITDYVSTAIKGCVLNDGYLTEIVDDILLQKVFSTESDAREWECESALLGMRMVLDDWIGLNGEPYIASFSSLWSHESFDESANAASRCSAITKYMEIIPYHCERLSDCFICQNVSKKHDCLGTPCYQLYKDNKTASEAEAECQKNNGTLAIPSSQGLFSSVFELLRKEDPWRYCVFTTIGFSRRILIEDYHERPIKINLTYFSEGDSKLSENCVIVNFSSQFITRGKCDESRCYMCTKNLRVNNFRIYDEEFYED